jgi:hypothetical protein
MEIAILVVFGAIVGVALLLAMLLELYRSIRKGR